MMRMIQGLRVVFWEIFGHGTRFSFGLSNVLLRRTWKIGVVNSSLKIFRHFGGVWGHSFYIQILNEDILDRGEQENTHESRTNSKFGATIGHSNFKTTPHFRAKHMILFCSVVMPWGMILAILIGRRGGRWGTFAILILLDLILSS